MKKKCTTTDNPDMYRMDVGIFALHNIPKNAKLSDNDKKELEKIKAVLKKSKCKRLYPNNLLENVSKLCSYNSSDYPIDSISYVGKISDIVGVVNFSFTTYDRNDFMLYLGALDALINGKQPSLSHVMSDDDFYRKYGAKVIIQDKKLPKAVDEWAELVKSYFK